MAHKKANLKRIANPKERITMYRRRKTTVFKKAEQLSTLCEVPVCILVYGPPSVKDEVVSVPEIWPRDETTFRDIIRQYKATVSNSCTKETHVETFVNDVEKATEMESITHDRKRLLKSSVKKYNSWEPKLENCSLEQLRGLLCALDNKLHEAVTRQERWMSRVHHDQAIDTPIPLSLMDQNYMQQYFSEQPQFPSFPINCNNMGFAFISPHDHNQIQVDPNLIENRNIKLGLNQGLMMSKGNDGTHQLMHTQAQPYYNREPVVQWSAAYNVNPLFAGYQVPINSPNWRLSGNQVEDLSGEKTI